MEDESKLQRAFVALDSYNALDPHKEATNGKLISKELLYAQRMSNRLLQFHPKADEAIQLAVRSQHIGRWEIPRSTFPDGKKGYLLWRSKLKLHHSEIAAGLLREVGYTPDEIDRVCFLILKKQLKTDPETQLLEDVVCLVFIEFYLTDFADKHPDDKVIDILRKTLLKMSPRAIEEAKKIVLPSRISDLIVNAVTQ